MKFFRLAALFLALLTGLSGAATAASTRSINAMDTAMTVNAPGADKPLLDACDAEAARLEKLLSVTRTDSEISHLNAYGSATLSPDTAAVLRLALDVAEATDGALDVTIYPLARAWGFNTGNHRVPTEAERFRLLRYVNWKKISLEGNRASVPEGVMVDLGALARGYAVDRVADLLWQGGVDSALIDMDGTVCCLGSREDGGPWRMGIRDPRTGVGLAGIVVGRDCALATSGGYVHAFRARDGKTYSHIFDPATGMPAKSGVISATVIGAQAALCDALSTALCVMGREKAAALLAGLDDVEAILIDEDGGIWLTPGVKGFFTPQGEYAKGELHWME